MDNLPINITDLAVLAVLLISGLLAFARGLVKEVLSVAGWIGAAFATLYLFPYASPYARQYTDIQIAADAATGLGLFVVSLVILSLLSHMIARQVRASSISALDRSLGFLFGLARGAILVAIAYLLLIWTIPPADHPPVIREARVIFFVEKTARVLALIVPPETRARIEEVLDRNMSSSGSTKVKILNAPPASPNSTHGSTPESGTDSGSETGYNPQIREGLERILRSKTDE